MTDTFRKGYKTLHQDSAALILEVKERAEDLEDLMANITNREMSLAMTNLEQSIMWATKAIVLADEQKNFKHEP